VQGVLEKQQTEKSIREREIHLKAVTYLQHLVSEYIMKTVVFENSEQLPPLSELKTILQQALKSSLARQQQSGSTTTLTTSNSTPNTIYSEIERHIDEYTEYLLNLLKLEIEKKANQKEEPQLSFNIKQVSPLKKEHASEFTENMKKFSIVDLVSK